MFVVSDATLRHFAMPWSEVANWPPRSSCAGYSRALSTMLWQVTVNRAIVAWRPIATDRPALADTDHPFPQGLGDIV